MLNNEVMMGIAEFILGGRSEFTIYQNANGKEVKALYKVCQSDDGGSYFVYASDSGKCGMDYQGYIKKSKSPEGGYYFKPGVKGKNNTRLVNALMWVLKHSHSLDDRVHVLHHGRCSVCGRKLTDSKSLVYGIGPVCLSKMNFR